MKKIMPKNKTVIKQTLKKTEKKVVKPADELEKIIEVDTEIKDGELELVPGEVTEEESEEEEAVLDDEEVDPFKDKWEE